jgi:hypothetical protein
VTTKRKPPTRKRRSWRFLDPKPSALQKKLGILGTRGGAVTAIGWVIGIAVTPWLRWFVAGSLLLGLLFATIFQYLHNRELAPPDILKSED